MKRQQIVQLFMLLLSICSKALDINSTSNLTALSTLFIAINGTYINSSIVYSNLTSPIANLSSSLTVNAINDSSIELSNVSSMTSASSVVISNSVMPFGSNSSNASSLALNMSTMNITNTSIAISKNVSSSYLLATLSSFPSLRHLCLHQLHQLLVRLCNLGHNWNSFYRYISLKRMLAPMEGIMSGRIC